MNKVKKDSELQFLEKVGIAHPCSCTVSSFLCHVICVIVPIMLQLYDHITLCVCVCLNSPKIVILVAFKYYYNFFVVDIKSHWWDS